MLSKSEFEVTLRSFDLSFKDYHTSIMLVVLRSVFLPGFFVLLHFKL